MEQYISKSALLAEIGRLKADALQKKSQCKRSGLERMMHQIGAYNKILSFLDTLKVKEVGVDLGDHQVDKRAICIIDTKTLEVKEVDFEKEFKRFLNEVEGVPRMWHSGEQIEWAKDLAKHFLELGMSVSNKAQKGEWLRQ